MPVAPGVRNVVYGTSYIQTVHFTSAGVDAHAFLSYSQSSDPASPHYADQAPLFAEEKFKRPPMELSELLKQATRDYTVGN